MRLRRLSSPTSPVVVPASWGLVHAQVRGRPVTPVERYVWLRVVVLAGAVVASAVVLWHGSVGGEMERTLVGSVGTQVGMLVLAGPIYAMGVRTMAGSIVVGCSLVAAAVWLAGALSALGPESFGLAGMGVAFMLLPAVAAAGAAIDFALGWLIHR